MNQWVKIIFYNVCFVAAMSSGIVSADETKAEAKDHIEKINGVVLDNSSREVFENGDIVKAFNVIRTAEESSAEIHYGECIITLNALEFVILPEAGEDCPTVYAVADMQYTSFGAKLFTIGLGASVLAKASDDEPVSP